MHLSSYDKAWAFMQKYMDPYKSTNILDVGSAATSGSYANLFISPNWRYEGCDIVPGPNVNFVMESPYTIQRADNAYDVVISGQAMEHVEYFWVWIKELVRVMKSGGLLFLIAPGSGRLHDVIDCWRFHPDGMTALARWAGLEKLETFMTQENEWWDCVLIARKP